MKTSITIGFILLLQKTSLKITKLGLQHSRVTSRYFKSSLSVQNEHDQCHVLLYYGWETKALHEKLLSSLLEYSHSEKVGKIYRETHTME